MESQSDSVVFFCTSTAFRDMHIVNAIWWRHAYVFSVCTFLQALWITLQLHYHWSNHWYGIFLPCYLLLIYWAAHMYMLAMMRGDDCHRHAITDSKTPQSTSEYDARTSWDASPNYASDEDDTNTSDTKTMVNKVADSALNTATHTFDAKNLYRNDASAQDYTAEEAEVGGAYHQQCTRDPDETIFSYRLRRALDAQQFVRLSCFAAALVQLILLLVKLETPDAFGWWIWWLVCTIMLGPVLIFSVVGAFWVPLRAWYLRAYIEGQRAIILKQNQSV